MQLDLRDWLKQVEEIGQLQIVKGAEVKKEIGGIVDVAQEKVGSPALLFENIPGFSSDYKILANPTFSKERIALALGLPAETKVMDIVKYWKKFLLSSKQISSKIIDDGPILENVYLNEQVDVSAIPTPIWHELDGGPYIGTGCMVIQRDPDTNWVNVGCYRVQTFDSTTLGIMMTAGRHGDTILKKYWDRKEACPVAISVGQHPLLLMLAGLQIPYGVCEYDVLGGFTGESLEVLSGPITGLPVPAFSEIVIEGEIPFGKTKIEGPFGEWAGYYASGARPQPIIEVKSLLFRNNPIMVGNIPRRPPNDDQYYCGYLGSGAIWGELESAGLQGIKGVWALEASGSRMFTVISIQQMYPGHAKQVALAATSCHSGAYANKYVVVVDEDIDPTNVNDVIWAMCTRVDPREDVEMIKRNWSSPLDPTSYPENNQMYNARLLIDACIPWDRRHTFPKVAQASPELRKNILEKWGDVLFDYKR